MPVYSYKAKIRPDEFKTGIVEAESERAAVNKLLKVNHHPVSIKLQSDTQKASFKIFNKIKTKEIYVFLRQLSNLTQAGMSLIKALTNISEQSSNLKLKTVVEDLVDLLQKGNPFSEALATHPEIFNVLEINMIKSSESSSTLPEVITKIADLKEKEIQFSYKIKSALSYPILLISVGLLTLFVLTTFVLPKFISLFQDLEQQLPLSTQLLITFSLFLEKFWPLIVSGVIVLYFILSGYLKTEFGKSWFDGLCLKVPFLKDIIIRVQGGRFARTLASLIENGVPILNSLQIVSEVITNKIIAKQVKQLYLEVSKGKHISEALKNNRAFDQNTVDLIAVGEQSGKLEDMLLRIASMNENEASQKIESFVFILEPSLILILGAVIAFVVMAILLPIFQMNFLIQ